MTILEQMADKIDTAIDYHCFCHDDEGKDNRWYEVPHKMLPSIARAARDALVLGLTEGFVEDLVDNGVIWVIDCDEICWDLPRVRAALIEATEVDG